MTVAEFAQSIVDEVCRLQLVNHLQVQTLSDFVRWYIDPKIKLSHGVSKNDLEHLCVLTKTFLAAQLELSSQAAEDKQKEADYRVQRAVRLLLDIRIELLLARSNHYLKIIRPIYDLAANPNVVWDVYTVCTDGQDMAVSHLKGSEIWAKRALMQLEMRLKQNGITLSSEQEETAWQQLLTDARRVH